MAADAERASWRHDADWNDIVRGHLPEALASANARLAIERTLDAWCPAALSCLFIECRLAEAASQVDLIFGIDESRRPVFASADWASRWRAPLVGYPIWRDVLELARQWAHGAHPWLRSIWLEFDLDGVHARREPCPSIFLEVEHARARRTQAGWWDRIVSVLAATLQADLSPETVAGVRACVDDLPSHAIVNYVGVMLARGAGPVRLCVSKLSNADVVRVARRHGWAGNRDHLARVMADIGRVRKGHVIPGPGLVHLNVGGRLDETLGIEYVLARRGQVEGRVDERRLLDHLVDVGLCAPVKRDALLQWPGYSIERFAHALWPTVVSRRLNNIKLVFGPDASLFAKGYVCATSRLRRARRRVAEVDVWESHKEASWCPR
jgi:hypothetical protein